MRSGLRSGAECRVQSADIHRTSVAGKMSGAAEQSDTEEMEMEETAALDAPGAALTLLGAAQGAAGGQAQGAQAQADGGAAQPTPGQTSRAPAGGTADVAPTRRTLKAQATRTPPGERDARQQAGSAAGALEEMFAALRQELRQDLSEFQGRTDAKLDQVQRVVRSAIEPLEARQHNMEGQISAHDMAINEMRQQIADIKHAQSGTEAAVTEVKREMAMADAQAPPPPQPSAGWDRAPDRTKVRISCKAEVAIAQLEEAIKPLLVEANVQAADVVLDAPMGAKVSTKWTMQFKGETRKAARRADTFMEQLRGPGGWKDVTVQLPSGGTERIYISPDKSLKTVRTEIHTKKLKDILTRLYLEHAFYPQRRDGVVAARYKPVVKLDVREEATTLLFNEVVLREMAIDKGDVIRAWEREAATPSQSVEWRS